MQNISLRLFLAGAMLTLAGCADMAYYRQAISGHWELMDARRPVETILVDPTIPPDLQQRLQTALALREFASRELALPDNGSYRSYADLHRPFAVWNVFVAPELSLEPREWCFPVLGCVRYRGYFKDTDAHTLAGELRKQGHDVYVAGVPAYSTLGWFDDPLLNTFINWPIGRLAELLFHELAHQRLYIADDTTFNESFATAVGRIGTPLWLERHGTMQESRAYQEDIERRDAFLNLVLSAKAALAILYNSDQSQAAKLEGKRRIFEDLQTDYQAFRQVWDGYGEFDDWFVRDLNNAKLAALNAYAYYVSAFEGLFERAGRDFETFYRAVEEIGDLPPKLREVRLQALMMTPETRLSRAGPFAESDCKGRADVCP